MNLDLHDYQDMAENYDNYLAELFPGDDGFLDFYGELARQYGGQGIIGIGCGTGAVLLHLAQQGHSVEGADLFQAM